MNYLVHIMAGQSNMHGADAVINVSTKTLSLAANGTQTAADLAALFKLGGAAYTTPLAAINGHQGTSLGVDNVAGAPIMVHGPEVGLNRTLYASSSANRVYLKYTDNFSALESGKSPWAPSGTRWTAWQAFVDAQLAAITAAGNTYTIVGFFWAQGIDDGLLARTKASYTSDLRAIITALRTKFGLTIPFILSRSINSAIAGSTNMAPIREGQLEVAADQYNYWVDLDDLTPYVNTHHMTSVNQIIHGNRYATTLLSVPAAPLIPGESSSNIYVMSGGVLTPARVYVMSGGVLTPATLSVG